MEFFHILIPLFFCQILTAHADVQIAVPGVAQHHDFKGIMIPHRFHMFNRLRHFMDRNHEIVCNGHVRQDPQGFLAAAAQGPQTVVCFQHFQRAGLFAQLA